MAWQKIKTEHGGAKNGGGFWGERTDAKRISRKIRRQMDWKMIEQQLKTISN